MLVIKYRYLGFLFSWTLDFTQEQRAEDPDDFRLMGSPVSCDAIVVIEEGRPHLYVGVEKECKVNVTDVSCYSMSGQALQSHNVTLGFRARRVGAPPAANASITVLKSAALDKDLLKTDIDAALSEIAQRASSYLAIGRLKEDAVFYFYLPKEDVRLCCFSSSMEANVRFRGALGIFQGFSGRPNPGRVLQDNDASAYRTEATTLPVSYVSRAVLEEKRSLVAAEENRNSLHAFTFSTEPLAPSHEPWYGIANYSPGSDSSALEALCEKHIGGIAYLSSFLSTTLSLASTDFDKGRVYPGKDRTHANLMTQTTPEKAYEFVQRLNRHYGEPYAVLTGVNYVDTKVGLCQWIQLQHDITHNPDFIADITQCRQSIDESQHHFPPVCKAVAHDPSPKLQIINKALDNLALRIGKLNQHPWSKAYRVANQLLNNLRKAADAYTSNPTAPNAETVFNQKCSRYIADAKPILAKDLGWGDYLLNLLKTLCSQIMTLSRRSDFFPRVTSTSTQAINTLEEDLQLSASNAPH